MNSVYRSKIDWWVWLVLGGSLAVVWLSAIGMPWWYAVLVCGGMTALYVVLTFGCWYRIDGEDLLVYMYFSPTRIPISKIKSIKKTTGYIATAGMSHLRVSISFTDRLVLKSFAPLQISPKDRDGIIKHLCAINPMIEVHE